MADKSDPRSGCFVIITPVSPYVHACEDAHDRLDVGISDDPGNEFLDALALRYLEIDEYTFDTPETRRVVVTLEPNHFTTWD